MRLQKVLFVLPFSQHSLALPPLSSPAQAADRRPPRLLSHSLPVWHSGHAPDRSTSTAKACQSPHGLHLRGPLLQCITPREGPFRRASLRHANVGSGQHAAMDRGMGACVLLDVEALGALASGAGCGACWVGCRGSRGPSLPRVLAGGTPWH